MAAQLSKWLAYYNPLFRGRFDFFTSSNELALVSWNQGLALTGGRFWVRVRGGHDLRRTIEPPGGDEGALGTADWQPSQSDPLVGRSDGPATTVTTFPWVRHAPGTTYRYGLSVVGAGGVPEFAGAPLARAGFDDTGALVGPAPNAVTDLSVESCPGGTFRLLWMYEERDEEAQPSRFLICNDVTSPGVVDYDMVIGTTPYRRRRGYFSWISKAFLDGKRLNWGVRAESSSGVVGPASNTVFGTAAAARPDEPSGIIARLVED